LVLVLSQQQKLGLLGSGRELGRLRLRLRLREGKTTRLSEKVA